MTKRATTASHGRKPAANRFEAATTILVDDFRSRRPLRAGSLLMSVFGDSIAPRGGRVWLGSLIRALEGFGVNQRLVRTSVFRLARDGWLQSEAMGRRSDYFLTEEGLRSVDDASRRIYGAPQSDWDGRWTLVMLSPLPGPTREQVRARLTLLGFAPFSSSLLAHPHGDHAALIKVLASIDGAGDAVVMRAHAGSDQAKSLTGLVDSAWSLGDLRTRYGEFITRFMPLLDGARRARRLPAECAFQARTLLIHEYRKIVLRDPLLPEDLLPSDWQGKKAYRLCRDLYGFVREGAEHYIDEQMETAAGPMPAARPGRAPRFAPLAEDA